MIFFENCANIVIENNSFLNNEGNIFYLEASQARSSYNYFINDNCFFISGCLLNLQKKSNIIIKSDIITNLSNNVEGGVYSLSFSEMIIQNTNITNIISMKYATFALLISSFLNISYVSTTHFFNGAIYAVESILNIEQTNFTNSTLVSSGSSNKTLEFFCLSTLCLFDLKLLNLKQIIFLGNKNSTNIGGVK